MSKPRPPFAKVTRLMPEGSALSRSGGQPIAVGAEVADGEAVVLATPGGVPGAVTLDRRGVAITIKTVALATAPESVPVHESGPRVSADPVLPMAGSVGVRALAADPRSEAPPAQPILAVPTRGTTRQPAPVVKPVLATISDDGPKPTPR